MSCVLNYRSLRVELFAGICEMSVNLGKGPHSRKVREPLFFVNKRETKEEGYKKRKEKKEKEYEELTHSKSILLRSNIILTA
jgi:hypothetical protein